MVRIEDIKRHYVIKSHLRAAKAQLVAGCRAPTSTKTRAPCRQGNLPGLCAWIAKRYLVSTFHAVLAPTMTAARDALRHVGS
jgi:hypothetical protein